jgi:cell division transport system permease protein
MIIHNLSNTLIDSVNSKLTISLYLKDEYPKESPDTRKLLEEIEKQFANVKIDFKTKDEVLEEMRKKDEELVSIIKWENPLPATINLSNIRMEEYKNLDYIIESKLYILSDFRTNTIYDYRTQYERIEKILVVLTNLKFWLYIFIWIFLLSIFIITYSIIWNFVYHYRDEIYITRLVWWWRAFIYWPFIIQWMLYSIFWFIVSTNVFIILTKNIDFIFSREQISNYLISSNLNLILLIQILLFIFIWWFSAYLSCRRYTKN